MNIGRGVYCIGAIVIGTSENISGNIVKSNILVYSKPNREYEILDYSVTYVARKYCI